MNEKRFVLCKKGDVEYIEDNNCIQLYGFDVVCEMLNSLNEENEQLQKQVEILQKEVRDFIHLCEVCDVMYHISDECDELINDE